MKTVAFVTNVDWCNLYVVERFVDDEAVETRRAQIERTLNSLGLGGEDRLGVTADYLYESKSEEVA